MGDSTGMIAIFICVCGAATIGACIAAASAMMDYYKKKYWYQKRIEYYENKIDHLEEEVNACRSLLKKQGTHDG